MTPRRRIGLLVNPTAGRGRAARLGARAAARLLARGCEVRDLSAVTAAEAVVRARAAVTARDLDVLAVVGGDGMTHLGTNVCARTPVPLGIVAAGSGNDIAGALGLPVHSAEAAADVIADGQVRVVDAGLGHGPDGGSRWWLGVLGGGFDSVVNERAARWTWAPGPVRYNLAIARELPMFRAIPYAVTVDGARHETEAMLVAVANGPSFGGGMRVCPDARLDDGLFDVLILHRISVREFVRVFPRVFRGTHVSHPAVEILRGSRVRLEADGIISQADGERFLPLPLDLENVPGALGVLVPTRPAGDAPGGLALRPGIPAADVA